MKIILYVKQHNVTKLKYFGKTTKDDPYGYKGSGKYWRKHLKKHGNDVTTLEIFEFDDIESCETFALEFSHKHNIAESTEWANLILENGRNGVPTGTPGLKGKDSPTYGMTGELNGFYGKKHTPENLALFRSFTRGKNANAKRCRTPLGEFECTKDAADAHKLHFATIRKCIHNGKPDYEYIQEV